MLQIIEACDVKVGDLIGSNDGRNLQVMKITSAKSKRGKILNFHLDDGTIRKGIVPEERTLLITRPAV